MKILHILKTEPDENTSSLIDIVSEGEQSTVFKLYEAPVDYEALIDAVFAHDKVISWW